MSGRDKTKRKYAGALLRYVLIAVIGLVIGFAAYSFNAKRIVGNPMPMPFGVGASVVMSGSMEPSLNTGDLILAARAEEYSVGDIVIYRSESASCTVHRIVSILDAAGNPAQTVQAASENGTVTTRGDANNTDDPPISPQDIVGRVVGRLPGAGDWILALKTPVSVGLLLGAALLLLLTSRREEPDEELSAEIRELKRQIEELRQDQK